MYTKESFCSLVLRKKYDNVKAIIETKPYHHFFIPKKNGKRKVHYLEKESELAILQQNLVKNFLNKQPLPVCAKGFKKNENYNNFLTPHIDSEYYLRIDIKSFFPSLKTEVIKRELSNFLNCDSKDSKDELLDLLCEIITLNGELPQGAYTSPAVSNLVMTRVDQRILKYCQSLGIKYTRYADDLLFSSTSFCFREKKWFLKKIKYILSYNHLELNYTKIRYAETELTLNGYVVSCEGIRLSRGKMHDIRKVTSFVKQNHDKLKNGQMDLFLEELNALNLKKRDLKEKSFTTLFQVVQYLNGNRAFMISMLQEDYAEYRFQKDLKKMIDKVEKQVLKLYKVM